MFFEAAEKNECLDAVQNKYRSMKPTENQY